MIDAGFYSKDLILWEAWSDGALGPWLWAAGLLGALLTAIYIFRAVFVVFFGPVRLEPTGPTGWRIAVPLIVLSILALIGGFVEIPPYLGNVPAFSRLMQSALPAPPAAVTAGSSLEIMLSAIAAVVAFARRRHRLYRVLPPARLPGGAGPIAGEPCAAALLGNRLGIRLAVRPGAGAAVSLVCPDRPGRFHRQLLQRPGCAEPSCSTGNLSASADRSRTPVCGGDRGRLHYPHRDPGVRMILLWLILTPLIGGVLAGFCGRRNNAWPRWLSLAALAIDLALVLVLWCDALRRCGHRQRYLARRDRLALDPATRHPLHLGLDGLSLLLILLTLGLGIMSVVASWTEITERVGFFHFNLMLTLAGVIGVFLALDLFLFFFFWELMLVPMYFLIAIWGHERADLRRHQVLPVHPGKRAADVRCHPGTRLHQLPPDRDPDIRLFRAGRDAARLDDADVAHARLLHRLRREAAGRAVPYLASRRSHRGADRRQRHPRRPAPENRRLWPAALRRAALSRGVG